MRERFDYLGLELRLNGSDRKPILAFVLVVKLVFAVCGVASNLLAIMFGQLYLGGDRTSRRRRLEYPSGPGRSHDSDVQISTRVDRRRRHTQCLGASVRCVELDDVAKEEPAVVERVPP